MSVTWEWFTKKDRWSGARVLRTWVNVLWITASVGAIVAAGVYGITKATRAAGAASCRTFASQSGYPSQYRVMHFLDSGTCFVQLPNGHSLPQKMVTGYLRADKG